MSVDQHPLWVGSIGDEILSSYIGSSSEANVFESIHEPTSISWFMSLVDCDHWSIVVIPPRYTNWFVICVQVVLYQWYLYTPGVTSGYVFSPTCSDLSSPQLLDRPGWGRMLVPNECAKLLLRRIPGAKWWDGNTYVTYVYYTFQPNLVAEFWTVSVFGMGNILYPRGVGFKHLSFSHHFCGEIILFDYCNIFLKRVETTN